MSATVISRSVASTPKRSASETWTKIIEVIAPESKNPARGELQKVSGIASSVIAAESPKDDPFVVYGGRPRVRIYCLYGDDAILSEKASEDPVRQSVTGDGWKLSIPCEEEDFDWISKSLKKVSNRITARKRGTEPVGEVSEEKSQAAQSSSAATVDLTEFFKS